MFPDGKIIAYVVFVPSHAAMFKGTRCRSYRERIQPRGLSRAFYHWSVSPVSLFGCGTCVLHGVVCDPKTGPHILDLSDLNLYRCLQLS